MTAAGRLNLLKLNLSPILRSIQTRMQTKAQKAQEERENFLFLPVLSVPLFAFSCGYEKGQIGCSMLQFTCYT